METIEAFMSTVSTEDEARFANMSQEDRTIASNVADAISTVYGEDYTVEKVACMLQTIDDIAGDALTDADIDEPFSVVNWLEEKLEEI